MTVPARLSPLFLSLCLLPEPVRHVVLSQDLDSQIILDNPVTPSHLYFTAGKASPLRCVAYGGSPPPVLELRAGSRPYSRDLRLDYHVTMRGQPGLRTIDNTSVAWTADFTATAQEDGGELSCVASVRGLVPVTRTSRMEVKCE